MNLEEKKHILKNHPLFKDLDNTTIAAIAERVVNKIYPPNTILIRQGDPPGPVYITYSGLLKSYFINEAGKTIPTKISEEKDFVGDLGAVDGEPIGSYAETLQETHTLIMTKEDFQAAIEKYPMFARNVLRLWAKKVRTVNRQREISFSLQLQERTLVTLQTLSPHFPNKEITLSHEELAQIIGATRARVSEVLQELEKQHVISLSNRKIKVL